MNNKLKEIFLVIVIIAIFCVSYWAVAFIAQGGL